MDARLARQARLKLLGDRAKTLRTMLATAQTMHDCSLSLGGLDMLGERATMAVMEVIDALQARIEEVALEYQREERAFLAEEREAIDAAAETVASDTDVRAAALDLVARLMGRAPMLVN